MYVLELCHIVNHSINRDPEILRDPIRIERSSDEASKQAIG
jgi:hypothetical protein